MPPIIVEPRPLSSAEAAVLVHVLSADFQGAVALRSQINAMEVVAQWQPGSTSVDFRASGPTVRSSQSDGPIPVEAIAANANGEPVGEILVWVVDGVLAALEHAWWTDDMPAALPLPDRISVRPQK